MKKLKLWYYRNFKVISNEKAKELGLLFWENVYGDSINHYGCRSIWFDYRHRAYRVEGLVETKNEFKDEFVEHPYYDVDFE